MILTVMQIHLRRLLHSRGELMLTFLVPILFFSIFAMIFGGGTTPKIKVVVVDEEASAVSIEITNNLTSQPSLRLMNRDAPTTLTRQDAEQMVRRGSATLAIILHRNGTAMVAKLLTDSSDQVASQVVSGLVSRCIMEVEAKRQMAARPSELDRLVSEDDHSRTSRAPTVEAVDVIGEGKTNPAVSMYAAGIAVMFLLFAATGGGGALLEERENQTLDRLLSTRLSMDQLLLGKWFYIAAIGVAQVSVMFVWAQLVFGVDLLGHLDGFLLMTVATALAASGFGLFLATLCKTRGQLNGLSVILVLTMSAMGGSMVPRYVMSESMQKYGLWTFNAWALDGYTKVFWRDLPVSALAPQLGVLMLSGFAFLIAARLLAVRWETD